MNSNASRIRTPRAINVAVQLALIFSTFFPFYFMLISSVKNNVQISQSYFLPVLPLQLENYGLAFQKVITYLYNSTLICTVSALGVAAVSCLTSYVFARFEFPGKNGLFNLLLAFLMIPGVLSLIPSFALIARMNLTNRYWGCILPYIAFGQITFVFILRTFIEQIPRDLFDAATIDGATHPMVFRYIVLPLSRPILFSLVLMNFLANWNDFIWPLLVLPREKMKTVTVGLYAFTDVQQIQYGLMFAGFVIAAVPLILLFALNMNAFVRGATSGAIKA